MTLMSNCFATSILAICWCRFCCSVERLANQLAFVPPRPHNYYLVVDANSTPAQDGDAAHSDDDNGNESDGMDARTKGHSTGMQTSIVHPSHLNNGESDFNTNTNTNTTNSNSRHCIYMSTSSISSTTNNSGKAGSSKNTAQSSKIEMHSHSQDKGRRKQKKVREDSVKPPWLTTLQASSSSSSNPLPAHILLSSELRKEPYFVSVMKYVSVTALTTARGSTIPTFMIYYENNATVRERQRASTPTLLFSHGNATDCVLSLPLLIEMSRRLHINVFTYEYTGYGGRKYASCEIDGDVISIEGNESNDANQECNNNSTSSSHQASQTSKQGERRDSSPTISNTLSDIEAAFSHLVNDLSIPPDTIIVYGQSVGTGPSCHLCSQYTASRSLMGLVLHSALASGLRVIGNDNGICAPASMLGVCDVYVNKDLVSSITCPVFVIHGKEDEEIHYSHGVMIYDRLKGAAKYTPWWVDGAGHNDIIENETETFFSKLREFILYCQNNRGDSVYIQPPENHKFTR